MSSHSSYSDLPARHETVAGTDDLNSSAEAILSYSRIMHQHTKRQMDMATRASARRTDGAAVSVMGQWSSQGSEHSEGSLHA